VRVVRINGVQYRGASAPARPTLDAQAGAGLIETMRACDGQIVHRALHLERLASSLRALGIDGAPDAGAIACELDAALEGCVAADAVVRLVVSARPACVVEVAPVEPLDATPPMFSALTLPGGWVPGEAAAEHKRTERDHWVRAECAAAAVGADIVLTTDLSGRLGEASRASVFVVADGVLWTAPARGLLPGIGRRVMMQIAGDVIVQAAERALWQRADEVFVVSALRGVAAIVTVDSAPVGNGTAGPVTRRLAARYRACVLGGDRAGSPGVDDGRLDGAGIPVA